jgi:hypothetical protein
MTLTRPGAASAALATLTLAFFSAPSHAAGICDATTVLAKAGCDQQATSRFSYSSGVCLNYKSLADKAACETRAVNAQKAAKQVCTDQTPARQAVCNAIGQAAYDPPINPADFSTTITNPLLPFKPGNVWVYRNGDAQVTVTVMPDTFVLGGVTCVVVHDVNRVSGKIEEDTTDYYAQRKDGAVWYFGEDTIAFDAKGNGSSKGSWRYGVAGAKPGVVMAAPPQTGKTYRQEFRLGVAEDMARNVAANQHVAVPFGTFNTAYKIHEFTPIEPIKSEDKFYVAGTGLVLAVDLVKGDREELVSFMPAP